MYTRFGDNDIVTRQAAELVTSTWSNNLNDLTVAFTSSTQANFGTATSSGQFFIEVYNADASLSTSEVQYSVAFGNSDGSGSLDFTNDTGSFGLGASKVIYNQYRQLHFNDDTQNFTFGNHTPKSIYVININRSRYKQRLTLGSLKLNLSGSAKIGTDQTEGIQLTDDSVTNGVAGTSVSLGPYYNVVSGSNGVLLGTTTNQITLDGVTSTYGFFYPEAGLIILNAEVFSGSLNPTTHGLASNTANKNHEKFLHHISCEGNNISLDRTGSFIVDTTEEINSQFYFARAQNLQFNYTNNESFVDANKNIRFETMKLNPKVFITTVGLYNDAFELMAIAKLSQPVAKDFTKEALIRIKLDY